MTRMDKREGENIGCVNFSFELTNEKGFVIDYCLHAE
jgi:hypothetical protein